MKAEAKYTDRVAASVLTLDNACQDSTFLTGGLSTLHQCRQSLLYTYVHAFYISNANELSLFEFQQGQLENYTDQLSTLLDAHDTDTFTLEDKEKLVNITRIVNVARDRLLHSSAGDDVETFKDIKSGAVEESGKSATERLVEQGFKLADVEKALEKAGGDEFKALFLLNEIKSKLGVDSSFNWWEGIKNH